MDLTISAIRSPCIHRPFARSSRHDREVSQIKLGLSSHEPFPRSHSSPKTTTAHTHIQVYAGVMILVYPIGIPLIFTFLLLKHRNKINPPIAAEVARRESRARAFAERQGHVNNPGDFFDVDDSAWTASLTSRSIHRGQDLNERMVSRAQVKVSPQDVKVEDDDGYGGDGGGGNDRASTVDLKGVVKEEEKTSQGPSFATDAHCEEVRSRGARAACVHVAKKVGGGCERLGGKETRARRFLSKCTDCCKTSSTKEEAVRRVVRSMNAKSACEFPSVINVI